jgi:hypothetical protein
MWLARWRMCRTELADRAFDISDDLAGRAMLIAGDALQWQPFIRSWADMQRVD